MRHDYDDIHRLVLKMREGSRDARNELIEAHVGLAFKVAQQFDDDEALSDALMTLVEEVDSFRGSDKHPAALPSYLKTALGRAASKSTRPLRKSPRHGQLGTTHNAANDAARFLHSGRKLDRDDPAPAVDLMDVLLELCETGQERAMVFYKAQSMTNAEVALRIGASVTFVQTSMQRLGLRFGVQEKLKRA